MIPSFNPVNTTNTMAMKVTKPSANAFSPQAPQFGAIKITNPPQWLTGGRCGSCNYAITSTERGGWWFRQPHKIVSQALDVTSFQLPGEYEITWGDKRYPSKSTGKFYDLTKKQAIKEAWQQADRLLLQALQKHAAEKRMLSLEAKIISTIDTMTYVDLQKNKIVVGGKVYKIHSWKKLN